MNVFVAQRWGKVVAVRAAEARGQGQGVAAQWVADLEDIDDPGAIIEGATVVANRRPRVHTDERPSFVMWGTFGGNIRTPWCIPVPWTSCFIYDVESHDMLDEHETMTVHLWRSPKTGATFYTIKDPERRANEGDGFSDQRRFLQISWSAEGTPLSFEMLGGSRRMARGGTKADGGRGDYVVVDAATSPQFTAWQTAITAAVNGMGVAIAERDAQIAALKAQVEALSAWATAAAAAIPVAAPAMPAGPGAATALPASVPLPADGVPSVDGSDAIPPAPLTTVGRIVTASPITRGL